MKDNIFITGKSVRLVPLSYEHLSDEYLKWVNSPIINQYSSRGRFPISRESLNDFIRTVNLDNEKLVLAVIDIASELHVGNITLQGINWVDRSAEIAFLLGESKMWGKGIMFESGELLIKHAFEQLNLNRIYCGTSYQNLGMQKLALKLGMKQEGVRRKAFFKNGTFHDIIDYSILKYEYGNK
jgi:ribosomal-protein-alanine N-acetyltransferase